MAQYRSFFKNDRHDLIIPNSLEIPILSTDSFRGERRRGGNINGGEHIQKTSDPVTIPYILSSINFATSLLLLYTIQLFSYKIVTLNFICDLTVTLTSQYC